MMAGGKGGRPKGGGIWPKGKQGRELENVQARREDKAKKRLVTPLGEADAPPEVSQEHRLYRTNAIYFLYRKVKDAELDASRIKLRPKFDYSDYQPHALARSMES